MKLSVPPIIYVFLCSVISAVYAVPVVVHTSGATTPGPHLETRAPSKDIINISFHNPSAQGGTGTPVPKIRTEIKSILTEWRKSNHVSKEFEVVYSNRFDGNIHYNQHDFQFWGSGVGEGCEVQEDQCWVWYEEDQYNLLGLEGSSHSCPHAMGIKQPGGRIPVALVILHQLYPIYGFQVKYALDFREMEDSSSERMCLRGKGDFRKKMGAEEEDVYICYPRGGLGGRGAKAVLDFCVAES
ncbi:hypothetical protein GG344DRAFT_62736 [Lentinula edodes]|nr:hypothetical protein GG344DRAFT_62736 [Lentinula edodes]